MINKYAGTLLIFILCSAGNAGAGQSSYDIYPGGSIAQTRDAIRSVNSNMSGDITVNLHGGDYWLDEGLAFDERDSGTNGFNVVYQAAKDEKPVIDGGKQVKGWVPAGNGIYKASIGSLPSTALPFRQLFVNGRRAVRARSPNAGKYNRILSWDIPGKKVLIPAKDISNWSNFNNIEMVIQRHWAVMRLRLSSFTIADNIAYVSFQQEANKVGLKAPPSSPQASYHFENSLGLLDAPGEWFLDTTAGEVYYKPLPGEDMNTAEVIAPVLERLITVQGTPLKRVHNIEFKNITFRGSTWLLPNSEGFVQVQANWFLRGNPPALEFMPYDSAVMPAAIHLQWAENIKFTGNTIKWTGANAVNLYQGTSGNELAGNVITDISGNGISVDLALNSHPAPENLCKNDIIRDNYIARVSRDYSGCVAIFGGYTEGLKVEHNEIFDNTYTGISVGWGWTAADTALKNNIIRYNKVSNVVNLLEDGGGIYTLSKQPGTLIEGNYLFNINRSPWPAAGGIGINGIYLDGESDSITVKNNVLENIERNRHGNGPGLNNVWSPEPDSAVNDQGVKENAGLSPEWRYIKKGIEESALNSAPETVREVSRKKVLINFGKGETFNRGKGSTVSDHLAGKEKARLRAEFGPGSDPGMFPLSRNLDWSEFNCLSFNVFVEGDKAWNGTVLLGDAASHKEWAKNYLEYPLKLNPGENTEVHIPVEGLFANNFRKLDPKDMRVLIFYNPEFKNALFFGNIYLVKEE